MFRLRPITRADRDALVRFHERLSADTRRRRYHAAKGDLTPRELDFLTDVDDDAHVAVVAVGPGGELGAIARVVAGDGEDAEVAVVVADDSQGRGLGPRVTAAALERFWGGRKDAVVAHVEAGNRRALALFSTRLGGRRLATRDGVATIRLTR